MFKVIVHLQAVDGSRKATMRAAFNRVGTFKYLTGPRVRRYTMFDEATAKQVAEHWSKQTHWGRNNYYKIVAVEIAAI